MATLVDRIKADIITTMKDREPSRLTESQQKLLALRTLSAEIKAYEVNNRKLPEDAEVIAILSRGVKQFRETLDKAAGANPTGAVREDIVVQEKAKIAIYELYLPQPLTPEELEGIVVAAVAQVGATSQKDMGAVMAVVRPLNQGKADGQKVSALVKQKLGG